MRPRSLKRAVLAHYARLDILCCLDPDDPLGIDAVGERVRRDTRIVSYHLRVLDRLELVARKRRQGEVGPTDYVLRIDRQPTWVSEIVAAHRRR